MPVVFLQTVDTTTRDALLPLGCKQPYLLF